MKIKSHILYIALGTLSLSCTKTEPGSNTITPEGQIVSFTQLKTKNSLLGSSSTLPSLNVIAYETDPNAPAADESEVVMFGNVGKAELSLDAANNLWGYTPARYWPEDANQELTFLAMSPSMEVSSNPDYLIEYIYGTPDPITNLPDNGLVYLPSDQNNLMAEDLPGNTYFSDDFLVAYYKIPEVVANHPDLVFASASSDFASASPTTGVNLNFVHALTAVSFSAKGNPDQIVTKITLNDVYNDGVVSYFSEFDTEIMGGPGLIQDFLYWEVMDVYSPAVPVIANVKLERETAKSLTPEGGIMMMIPMGQFDTEYAWITVEYTDNGTPVTQQLMFPRNHSWESGIHNNYTITLPEAVGDMTMSVTSTPWINTNHDISTEDWGPGNEGGGEGEG